MASTIDPSPFSSGSPLWHSAGLRYYSYSFFLRQRFGEPVYRISLDGRFTCPNIDGTVTTGGCVFCDNRSFSPSRRLGRREIERQLEDGMARVGSRYNCRKFIAYFQPGTNTYAPVDHLRQMYQSALAHPGVAGLAVGTRPDCVPNDVLDLLDELAGETYVSVEIGMQTMHDRSLDWMNRGHHHEATCDAMRRSRDRRFHIGCHLIAGLPGETRDDVLSSVDEMVRLGFHSVKIHNLYAVKDTPLADELLDGRVHLLELDEYVSLVVDILERLPPDMVVERLHGDAPPEYLIGPSWCADRNAFYQALHRELEQRDTWQGKRQPSIARSGD